MIQNWWTLFFNSVYEGPNGEWQVCTECGDCNACEGCIDCSGGAQVAFLKDTQKSTYSGLLLRSQGGLAKEK